MALTEKRYIAINFLPYADKKFHFKIVFATYSVCQHAFKVALLHACRAESRLSTARSDKAYNDFNVTAMPTRSCYNAIDPRFSRDGCSSPEGETRTKEVRFGNLHVCEGMDDKINDDWELMKDRRPGILCVNHTNRTDSGDAIEHGLSETYCSGVDQREQRYRDLGFILSDGLSESVKDLYATDMSNPLEEQEEFWADVKTYNFNIRETKRSSCYTILIVEWVYKDWFDICKAVKQGCVASPWLFSLPMNGCLHNPKECEYELRMVKLSVKCFLYADDQVILALSACDLKVATKMNDPVKKRDDTVMYEHSRFVVLGVYEFGEHYAGGSVDDKKTRFNLPTILNDSMNYKSKKSPDG
ncbi:hypothetical protein EVAR_64550_1 [Eumeta japonica]|uniref:Reverse transcriptase domain-containing protein n=1 Tax=Eumeta variegata TaxID=151549 RepID=A0A4C1ZVP4_EUMVA|nr:hypothetical protein EVAR_64550_1 [Eumeta japonica]